MRWQLNDPDTGELAYPFPFIIQLRSGKRLLKSCSHQLEMTQVFEYVQNELPFMAHMAPNHYLFIINILL